MDRGRHSGLRVLAAPDKYRGTATAAEVAHAIRAGVLDTGGHCDVCPLADGGEGTLDALGGANRRSTVTGPAGTPVDAAWRLAGGAAVIEAALVSGLQLAGGAATNDAVAATSRGTGELIAEALGAGATEIVVGIGGTACSDGGSGALDALGPLLPLPAAVTLTAACDVTTAFLDAPRIFGPQKGATPEQVFLLEHRFGRLAQQYAEQLGIDVTTLPGAGAGGGLAGGLAALGASLVSGFDVVARASALARRLAVVDLVVTGEGCLDAQSFEGKLVGRVFELAAGYGRPVLAVVGEAMAKAPAGLQVLALADLFGDEGRSDPSNCIRRAVMKHIAAAVI